MTSNINISCEIKINEKNTKKESLAVSSVASMCCLPCACKLTVGNNIKEWQQHEWVGAV